MFSKKLGSYSLELQQKHLTLKLSSARHGHIHTIKPKTVNCCIGVTGLTKIGYVGRSFFSPKYLSISFFLDLCFEHGETFITGWFKVTRCQFKMIQ